MVVNSHVCWESDPILLNEQEEHLTGESFLWTSVLVLNEFSIVVKYMDKISSVPYLYNQTQI